MAASQQLKDYERYVEDNRPKRPLTEEDQYSYGAICARWLLLAVNLVFLALGAVMIFVGVYLYNTDSSELTSKDVMLAAILMGVLVLIIAFMGCCGAKFNSQCLLCTYVIVLIAIIIAQIVIAAIILSDKSKATSLLETGWKDASNDVRTDLQNSFDCCGLVSFNDSYSGIPCPTPVDNSTLPPCLNKLTSDFNSKATLVGAIGIAFAVLEILGACLAMYLRSSIESVKNKASSS